MRPDSCRRSTSNNNEWREIEKNLRMRACAVQFISGNNGRRLQDAPQIAVSPRAMLKSKGSGGGAARRKIRKHDDRRLSPGNNGCDNELRELKDMKPLAADGGDVLSCRLCEIKLTIDCKRLPLLCLRFSPCTVGFDSN